MAVTYKITELVVLEAKHPSGSRTYNISYASVDGTNDGTPSDTGFLQSRTISSASVTEASGDITISGDNNSTTAVWFTAAGGTDHKDYNIDVVLTLSTGDIEPTEVRLPIRTPS